MKKILTAEKIFLPVIHIRDSESTEENIKTALEAEADGVFLICHNDNRRHERLLTAITAVKEKHGDLWVGANFLGAGPLWSVRKAIELKIDGLWSDTIGIDEDTGVSSEAEEVKDLVYQWKGNYFGSVAFKYQKEIRDLEKFTNLCLPYTDVVVTSGEATGSAPEKEKIEKMANIVKTENKPLAIASGVTEENVEEFASANIFMVATGISESFFVLDKEKTKRLKEKIQGLK